MLFQCLLDLLFLFIFLTGLVNCFTYDTCQKQFLSTRAQFTSLSSEQSHNLTVWVHRITNSACTLKKGLSQRFNRNGTLIAVCTLTDFPFQTSKCLNWVFWVLPSWKSCILLALWLHYSCSPKHSASKWKTRDCKATRRWNCWGKSIFTIAALRLFVSFLL